MQIARFRLSGPLFGQRGSHLNLSPLGHACRDRINADHSTSLPAMTFVPASVPLMRKGTQHVTFWPAKNKIIVI